MFLATHADAGAIIGRAAPDPVTAFLGGFLSHFLMDMVPHGDANLYESYQSKQKVKTALAYVTLDAVLTVYLILGIRETHRFDDGMNVSAGIVGGLLPDLVIGFYNLFKPKWLDWFHDLHFFFHNYVVDRKRDIAFASGVVMQIAILFVLNTRI
jgi:hypothetical protein